MENEFVSYSQAVALKELGFDEPCFTFYPKDDKIGFNGKYHTIKEGYKNSTVNDIWIKKYNKDFKCVTAPLYQQAFRWFREKHNLVAEIQAPDGKDGVWNPTIHKVYGFGNYYDYNNGFKTYEEAEQACLTKLIQIIKDGTRN